MSDEQQAFETILVKSEGPVLRITINRPQQMNALNQQVLEEIESVLFGGMDPIETRVVILEGAGDRAFVAGADIAETSMATVPAGSKPGSTRDSRAKDRTSSPAATTSTSATTTSATTNAARSRRAPCPSVLPRVPRRIPRRIDHAGASPTSSTVTTLIAAANRKTGNDS